MALVGLAAAAAAGVVVRLSAQRGNREALANLDLRTDSAAAAVFLARHSTPTSFGALARARAAGLNRLRADFSEIDILDRPELASAEVVRTRSRSRFLTGPSNDRARALRGFLSAYADAYGVTAEQAAGFDLAADYVNPSGSMAWVELQQRINGLPVFQGVIRGGFTARGELAATTGQLAAGIDSKSLPTSGVLTAAQAVSRSAADVGWNVESGALVQKTNDSSGRIVFERGPMTEEPTARLLYFPVAPGVARLAWATEIWGSPAAFLVVIDAEDGTVLFRKNLTEYQKQPATYSIYADDSPAPMSPSTVLRGSGTQAPSIGRTLVTLVGNEAPNTFNTLGWMTDGTSSTDGNNVQAGVDRDGVDGVDAAVTGANRVFNFAYDPATDDPATANYQRGEVTDVFYWTNVYHDRLYLLGFNEAAGNFQDDNFGRGGLGGDRISAEEQDSSSTNNANFSTASDGARGKMQMFVFTGPTPRRSSGLDHDVVLHELTHGTSSRLHGNAAGLSSQMSRGMGEGWSDFYARALLSSASENVAGVYAMGGWITSQLPGVGADNYYYGIRRFPYAVMTTVGPNGRPHNPLTFADIDAAQMNLSDGAYPPAFIGPAFEVHDIGEVWCMALLEVRARFINRLGFATGNQHILQIVTDAMKLDPINPTLLEGRDSLIAAATAGGGSAADVADIWAGFAVRGMGLSARVVNATNGTVVEAFDVPVLEAGAASLVSEFIPNGWADPGERVTVSLCIQNVSVIDTRSVTATLLGTGGVQSPSGVQSYGVIPAGGTACRNYTFTVGATCGAAVTATLQAQQSGASSRNLAYTLQVGTPVNVFSQNFDTVIAPGLPPEWTTSTLGGTANPWFTSPTSADSPPNRVRAGDPSSSSDSALVSEAATLSAGATLTFKHAFDTDTNYDGGVLEIAIGAGGFQDFLAAGGTFLSGGYSGPILPTLASPLVGRQAWTGKSNGSITTTAALPPAAVGQSVRFRWRIATDFIVGGAGWAVDDISLFTFRCEPPSTATFNRTGADYDGDGRTDFTVFRPSTGAWYVLQSKNGYASSTYYQWGSSTDVPLPADYDGDGRIDLAVYRPSTGFWYVLQSGDNYTSFVSRQWGTSTDVPVPADYDGDGKADFAVYRPSTGFWYVLESSTNQASSLHRQWGIGADVPLPADYDGDGKADLAVYRPSTGYWYVLRSSSNAESYVQQQWGTAGDIPVPADYDGDGKTDIAVYRPSTGSWDILESHSQNRRTRQWGIVGDVPVPGDYDGDGKTDLALYRPSTGYWYVLLSSTADSTYIEQQWR